MEKRENCEPITKASKKRAFGNAMATSPNGKLPEMTKRVVLGEITNTANSAWLNQKNLDLTSNRSPKSKSDSRLKKKMDAKVEREAVKLEIDVKDSPDGPQRCAHAPFIYQHLRSLEVEENRRVLPNYMERLQKDITPSMREILVDWLVEVADEYKLVSDTVYLTVNYIDRFLSSNALSRTKLQLLGVSSMLVASKYEEITPPHVEDFCYMTDNTYTREEVVNMERDVLKFLNYEMGNPTTKTFLRIFIKAAQGNPMFANLEFEFLACYIAELSLLDYACLRFLPSMIAASAVYLARITMLPNIHPWTFEMQQYTGYKSSELKECILAIHDLQFGRRRTSARAVKEKYIEHKFKCVAALCPPSEIPHHYFEAASGKLS